MNLRDTLNFHLSWLSGLRTSIFNGASVDVEAAGNDTACVLGQWIYANREKLAGDETFDQLLKVHAEFHCCAMEAASLAQQGQRDAALQRLDRQGSCHQKSDQVVFLASNLFNKLDGQVPAESEKKAGFLSAFFQ
jgi:hypothetical protein